MIGTRVYARSDVWRNGTITGTDTVGGISVYFVRWDHSGETTREFAFGIGILAV